jgi:hypothetical protein
MFPFVADSTIRIQLTEEGKSVVNNRNAWNFIGIVTYDEDGWCELPFWQFLGIFGGFLIRKQSDYYRYFVQ